MNVLEWSARGEPVGIPFWFWRDFPLEKLRTMEIRGLSAEQYICQFMVGSARLYGRGKAVVLLGPDEDEQHWLVLVPERRELETDLGPVILMCERGVAEFKIVAKAKVMVID